ncbi:hypothetical protein [Cupriavidus sp. UYPR2.512]|uniref:hypothetical protein n=1 Tax=Cupriavidus sp. UYPR2.512 TaxID=1080187 RepID=UPI0003A9F088|nr:hypothetical protein [Cupriavidus sp. UYPR2.512]UIF89717.1 hypothetical protein KAF44_38620 [Cupriavidus necator]
MNQEGWRLPIGAVRRAMTACGIRCGRVAGLHEALTSERTRRGGVLALPGTAPDC